MKVRQRHHVPHGVTLTEYVMFTPMDARHHPIRNHGGSSYLKVQHPTGEQQIVRVKVYNLLFHFLRASHTHQLVMPGTTRQGVRFLEAAEDILSGTEAHADLFGGIRIETTVAATTLAQAFVVHQHENPNNLRVYLNAAEIRSMTVLDYLQRARLLFNSVTQLMRGFGVRRNNVGRELTLPQKRMFGDIKSLLGYAVLGYKSDPIARNTWWRRQLPVVEDVNDEDEDMEQEEPATPALDVNRSLCRFCHENKQESGKNYIRWVNVIFRLRQQFPELDSTDDQIKNRYKLLVRKGSHLQYL